MSFVTPPATPGMPVAEVDTPALLVDLDAFEANLALMARESRAAGVALRPHAKAHKSAPVGLRQMAHGAVGLCCQKVTEAEVMALGGIPDVYVSNEIVGETKLHRLCALARVTRVSACVDSLRNVDDLGAAARACGVEIEVLVEIDAGTERCGVPAGEAVVPLARAIAATPGLSFGGLQAYNGMSQHFRTAEARKAASEDMVGRVNLSRAALEAAGLACPRVTGGGTGTYPYELASGVYTEIQPGSYLFMDLDYARNLNAEGTPDTRFRQSLFVYATVISRRGDERLVVDAGSKAVTIDSGPPAVHDHPGLEYVFKGDEHGMLRIPETGSHLDVGDKVMLVPAHCDPTVNMYDQFVAVRGGRVAAIWPIAGRGPGR